MKVLLINGSPNARGCTYTALSEVASTLEKEGVETEILHVGQKDIRGCIGCRKCAKFAPDKFTVNGFLAAVNYQAEAFPTAEDVSAVGCPTGALLTVEEHLKIEQNEPEWSAGKK